MPNTTSNDDELVILNPNDVFIEPPKRPNPEKLVFGDEVYVKESSVKQYGIEQRMDEEEMHLRKLQTNNWISYGTEVTNRIAELTALKDKQEKK